MNYTVIAYKENSDSFSMGCHMASYASDLLWLSTEDRTKVVFFLAERLCDNEFMERDEVGYEFTLLGNGEENPLDEHLDSIYAPIMEEASEIAREKIATRKEQDRLKHLASLEKAKNEERARELRTLAHLTQKYGEKIDFSSPNYE